MSRIIAFSKKPTVVDHSVEKAFNLLVGMAMLLERDKDLPFFKDAKSIDAYIEILEFLQKNTTQYLKTLNINVEDIAAMVSKVPIPVFPCLLEMYKYFIKGIPTEPYTLVHLHLIIKRLEYEAKQKFRAETPAQSINFKFDPATPRESSISDLHLAMAYLQSEMSLERIPTHLHTRMVKTLGVCRERLWSSRSQVMVIATGELYFEPIVVCAELYSFALGDSISPIDHNILLGLIDAAYVETEKTVNKHTIDPLTNTRIFSNPNPADNDLPTWFEKNTIN